jgi:hypothetical protein
MKMTGIIAAALAIASYVTMCASWEKANSKPDFNLCPLCGQEVKK